MKPPRDEPKRDDASEAEGQPTGAEEPEESQRQRELEEAREIIDSLRREYFHGI